MAFELPALPYATDALEPHIDKTTMEIHHDKQAILLVAFSCGWLVCAGRQGRASI